MGFLAGKILHKKGILSILSDVLIRLMFLYEKLGFKMKEWNFEPPGETDLDDHAVPRLGDNLAGKKVCLLITGGIASIRGPFIARILRKYGAETVVYATEEALRYTTAEAMEWSSANKVVTNLTMASEHLKPFDIYLVAPATYNTINKFASGIADNAVTTTLAAGLGLMERGQAKILIAPTMHGLLHNSILTESLKKLTGKGVRIIPPREDYGKHNIPSDEELLKEVCRAAGREMGGDV